MIERTGRGRGTVRTTTDTDDIDPGRPVRGEAQSLDAGMTRQGDTEMIVKAHVVTEMMTVIATPALDAETGEMTTATTMMSAKAVTVGSTMITVSHHLVNTPRTVTRMGTTRATSSLTTLDPAQWIWRTDLSLLDPHHRRPLRLEPHSRSLTRNAQPVLPR